MEDLQPHEQIELLRNYLIDLPEYSQKKRIQKLKAFAEEEIPYIQETIDSVLKMEANLTLALAMLSVTRDWKRQLEAFLGEIKASVIIDTPVSSHSRETSVFVGIHPNTVSAILRKLEALQNGCIDHLTITAREKGILSAGQQLGESAERQLSCLVRRSEQQEELNDTERAILDFCSQHKREGKTPTGEIIAEHISCSKEHTRTVLSDMKKRGLLVAGPNGRTGYWPAVDV